MTHLSEEFDVLVDRETVIKDVMLRAQTYARMDPVHVGRHIMAVDDRGAGSGWDKTYQTFTVHWIMAELKHCYVCMCH